MNHVKRVSRQRKFLIKRSNLSEESDLESHTNLGIEHRNLTIHISLLIFALYCFSASHGTCPWFAPRHICTSCPGSEPLLLFGSNMKINHFIIPSLFDRELTFGDRCWDGFVTILRRNNWSPQNCIFVHALLLILRWILGTLRWKFTQRPANYHYWMHFLNKHILQYRCKIE
jgi:hypothetical protein